MLRGSWTNWQKPAKGENSYQSLLFQISACQVKQKIKSHCPSLLNPGPLVSDPFSPRDSYCLSCLSGFAQLGWLSACLGQAGCWFCLLAITVSDSRFQILDFLGKLISSVPSLLIHLFHPTESIQYCPKYVKLQRCTQRGKSKLRILQLDSCSKL